jgi:Protein of unknown function (DUF2568)
MVSPNDVLRFFLELAALAALAYWGFSQFGGVAQWLIGRAAPVATLGSLPWCARCSPACTLRSRFALAQRPARGVAATPPR